MKNNNDTLALLATAATNPSVHVVGSRCGTSQTDCETSRLLSRFSLSDVDNSNPIMKASCGGFELDPPRIDECDEVTSEAGTDSWSETADNYSESELETTPVELGWDLPASKIALQRFLENESEPLHGYLETRQLDSGLTAVVRLDILVWLSELVKVHECDESVYCYAAQLLDTMLAKTKVQTRFLRIIAATCFILAAKTLLDECDQPLLEDVCTTCEQQFSVTDVKRMEYVILNKLGWLLPIASVFETLSTKFALLSYSYELLRNKQSTLAAALIALELPAVADVDADVVCRALCSMVEVGEDEMCSTSRFIARHLQVISTILA